MMKKSTVFTYTRGFREPTQFPFTHIWRSINTSGICLLDPRRADDIHSEAIARFDVTCAVFQTLSTISDRDGDCRRVRCYHIEPANGSSAYFFRDQVIRELDLNGAKFSIPSSETLETNAIGRGMMPLIIRAYIFLEHPSALGL